MRPYVLRCVASTGICPNYPAGYVIQREPGLSYRALWTSASTYQSWLGLRFIHNSMWMTRWSISTLLVIRQQSLRNTRQTAGLKGRTSSRLRRKDIIYKYTEDGTFKYVTDADKERTNGTSAAQACDIRYFLIKSLFWSVFTAAR